MKNLFAFVGGEIGEWNVFDQRIVKGEGIPNFSKLDIHETELTKVEDVNWSIKGFTSNVRYATREERVELAKKFSDLGRPDSTLGTMILLKKSYEWWNLSQDERRKIFEEDSHHTEIGLQYIPEIARKLFHSRDIGEEFDFITWFEYSVQVSEKFDELLDKLRKTNEWKYVTREVEIRLKK